MKKRVVFVLIFLLLDLILLSNFIFDGLFVKHNVELTKKEACEICKNKKCDYSIDIDYLKDNQVVFVDIKGNSTFSKIIEYVGFLLLVVVLIYYFYKKDSKEEDIDFTKCDFLIFSSLANYKIINICLLNIKELLFIYALCAVFIGYVVFFGFYFVFKFIFKNKSLSVLLSVFFVNVVLLGCNWREFFDCLKNSSYITVDNLMILSLVISIIALIFIFHKKINVILKKFAVILLFVCFLFNVYFLAKESFDFKIKNKTISQDFKTLQLKKNFNKNIYIIVLDMYSGYDVLESMGFKNDLFVENLNKRGFLVFKNIDSNFTKTPFSIPSFLNFDYPQNLKSKTPVDAIDNSILFNSLKKADYKIYYLNSFPETLKLNKQNYTYLLNLHSMIAHNFINTITRDTFFENYPKLFDFSIKNIKFDIIIDFFNKCQQDKNKKIVFAHLLMPHFPYLFDENENIIDSKDNIFKGEKTELNKESYIKYLKYTNKITLDIVDLIQSKDKNSIIILTGDHGSRLVYSDVNDEKLFKDEISKDNLILKSQFNTFLAYYNNECNKQNYKNSKTLLTFFRNFANEIFETNYTPEDKKFYIYFNQDISFFDKTKFEEINSSF